MQGWNDSEDAGVDWTLEHQNVGVGLSGGQIGSSTKAVAERVFYNQRCQLDFVATVKK